MHSTNDGAPADGAADGLMSPDERAALVHAIERPSSQLLVQDFITSLVFGPFFLVLFLPRLLRYRTLRYRFDEKGVSMRWGILFRREINLTYARIQDIHLRSGVIERHLGLARVEVQTASGSAKAEMSIIGVLEYEAVRDYLYSQMRGHSGADERATSALAAAGGVAQAAGADPSLAPVLREIVDELRALRRDLDARDTTGVDREGST